MAITKHGSDKETMMLFNSPPTCYQPQDAEMSAALLSDRDDEWMYIAKHDPKGTGYSLVAVYDEDGEFIGYM